MQVLRELRSLGVRITGTLCVTRVRASGCFSGQTASNQPFPAHCDISTKPVLLVRLGLTAHVLGRQESWAYISKDLRQWLLEVKDASVTQSAG